jgi:alkanesulfonate monooxygenase SsuD/methylene tetrahydromethanopterin reductase-like flavin-dependent oxidoreductase (luciferase family)
VRHPSTSSNPSLGLYFDFRNPTAWQRDPAAHYRWTLDLIEEADRRDIGSVWVTEHHFFDDGYLPQPLTALAAIAARTQRCRLGTAVVLAPLYPAVQIAEQAAIVDLISNGRLELGLGAGYVLPEFEAYGADISQRYPTTDETIAELGRLLDEDGVTPGPVQSPVPRWAGYLGPVGAGRAGRLGVGLLTLNRDSYPIYRDALEAAGHDPADARMAGVANFMIADDPEAAYERVLPHLTHQINSYRANASAGRGKPARKLSEDEVRSRGSGVIRPLEVLDADEAITRIRTLSDELPIEHIYLWASIGAMPDDLVVGQMELLTGQVQPALA